MKGLSPGTNTHKYYPPVRTDMVSLETLLTQLVDSIADVGPEFLDVATRDPISAVLIAFGALFVFASVGAFGALTFGALVDLLTPSRVGRKPPREAR